MCGSSNGALRRTVRSLPVGSDIAYGSDITPRVVIFAFRQVLSEVVGDDAFGVPRNGSDILHCEVIYQ